MACVGLNRSLLACDAQVGYGWMYGTAIVSGSWVVLAVALGSHLSQLMFLALVETPHIEVRADLEQSRSPAVQP